MPRTQEQNQEQRERTRQKLLEAALECFASQGYETTSVRQIAREAGVAQGLLYHYFASKEELLRAIFARCMAQVQDSFASGEAEGTPSERLERLLRRSFEIVRDNLLFWRLTYALRFQPEALASLQPLMEGWVTDIRATLERHLRELGFPFPEVEAILLFALVDGISQHYAAQPQTYPLAAVEAQLIRKYCGGNEEENGNPDRFN